MESARCPPPKVPSPTRSVASKGEQHKLSPGNAESPNLNKEITEEEKPVFASQQVPEKVRTAKAADVSEATHESMSVKEPASQGSAPLPEEEVQQKLVPIEAGNDQSLYIYILLLLLLLLGRDGIFCILLISPRKGTQVV
jgi:E3 ubiquitin-protein ligase RBBP6